MIPIEDLKQMNKTSQWDRFFLIMGLALFGTYLMIVFYRDAVRDTLRSVMPKTRIWRNRQ